MIFVSPRDAEQIVRELKNWGDLCDAKYLYEGEKLFRLYEDGSRRFLMNRQQFLSYGGKETVKIVIETNLLTEEARKNCIKAGYEICSESMADIYRDRNATVLSAVPADIREFHNFRDGVIHNANCSGFFAMTFEEWLKYTTSEVDLLCPQDCHETYLSKMSPSVRGYCVTVKRERRMVWMTTLEFDALFRRNIKKELATAQLAELYVNPHVDYMTVVGMGIKKRHSDFYNKFKAVSQIQESLGKPL